MRAHGLGLLLLLTVAGPGLAQEACRPRVWGGVDYLLWWVRPGAAPPLVVTGTAADPFPGALDQPGTRVLFGGNTGLAPDASSGVRLNLGTWLDNERL